MHWKCTRTRKRKCSASRASPVGGTSTSFGQFSCICPKKPEGARRSSDLHCPIGKNYELAQKNETECFQVLLKHGVLARRNLQAISLLPDTLWQYQRQVWLLEILKFMRYCWIMVEDSLLKLYWLHIQIVLPSSRRGATLIAKPFCFYAVFYDFPRLKYIAVQSTLKDPIEKKVTWT